MALGGVDKVTGAGVDNGLWAWDGEAWSLLDGGVDGPAAGVPGARNHHAIAYDEARHELILHGGRSVDGEKSILGDTWTWSTLRGWPERTADGTRPANRAEYGLAWDEAREELVLFGGDAVDAGGVVSTTDDTWTFDGLRWTQHVPEDAPSPRQMHVLSYQPLTEKTVLYGGRDGDHGPETVNHADTWLWDGEAWSPSPAGPTDNASSAELVWRASTQELVLWGGFEEAGATVVGATWTGDGTSWTKTSDAGPARWAHAGAWDPVRDVVVSLGGYGHAFGGFGWPTNQLQERSGAGWVDLGGQEGIFHPHNGKISQGAAAFHAGLGQVIFVGGRYSGALDQTWAWDGTLWTDLSGATGRIPARRRHEAVRDAGEERLLVFGGDRLEGLSNDLWALPLDAEQRPSLTARLDGAGVGFDAEDVIGVHVWARCGGTGHPYEASSDGAILESWSRTGLVGWTTLGATEVGGDEASLSDDALVEWSSTDIAELRGLMADPEVGLDYRCISAAPSGPGVTRARVAMDYLEARVRVDLGADGAP